MLGCDIISAPHSGRDVDILRDVANASKLGTCQDTVSYNDDNYGFINAVIARKHLLLRPPSPSLKELGQPM